MTATVPEFRFDPTDMAALRGKLDALPEAARFKSFELDRVEIGPDALLTLPGILDDLAPGPGPVLVVQDATPMRRGDQDLKDLVHRLLAETGREVRTVVLEAGDDGQAHADEHTVDQVFGEARGGGDGAALDQQVVDVMKPEHILRRDQHFPPFDRLTSAEQGTARRPEFQAGQADIEAWRVGEISAAPDEDHVAVRPLEMDMGARVFAGDPLRFA